MTPTLMNLVSVTGDARSERKLQYLNPLLPFETLHHSRPYLLEYKGYPCESMKRRVYSCIIID